MSTGNEKGREVFEKLLDLQRAMGMVHHKKMMERGPAADPMRGRGRIIALLKLKDGVPTREMAQILGIRVSSLNEVLAKLEKDGLVTRTASEEDRRVMLVRLTEKGREEQQGERFGDKLFAGFDEGELDAFGASLDKALANAEAELGEDAQAILEEERRRREEFFGHHGAPGWGRGEMHGHGHGPGAGPHPHGGFGDEGRGHGWGAGPHLCGEEGEHPHHGSGHGHGHARAHGHGRGHGCSCRFGAEGGHGPAEARFRHSPGGAGAGCRGFERGICSHECVEDPHACGARLA
jgi:DNA-binding MarR family transcriptional regulator